VTNRSTSRAARKRRGQAAGTGQATGAARQRVGTGPAAGRSAAQRPPAARATAAQAAADEALAPWDRGPVRAYLRDVVDARRHLLGILFVPAFGLAMITTFGPASDLQRLLLLVSLVALAVVLVEAVVRGATYTKMARAEFPDVPVNAVSSTFYAFMRAHRPRSLRKPPPRVGPS
jgi:uncharacterized membrane protein